MPPPQIMTLQTLTTCPYPRMHALVFRYYILAYTGVSRLRTGDESVNRRRSPQRKGRLE
jgi:hypothetical protein